MKSWRIGEDGMGWEGWDEKAQSEGVEEQGGREGRMGRRARQREKSREEQTQ
jgi:hypothetical protein